jgi:hypothetical protein
VGRGIALAEEGRHAAVANGPKRQSTVEELRELARVNGLALSEEDARDLQPYYDQQQRWLEQLRSVLDAKEEPATQFSATGTRDGRE